MQNPTTAQSLDPRQPYSLRLRTVERMTLEAAARARGLSLAEFVRFAATETARRELAASEGRS